MRQRRGAALPVVLWVIALIGAAASRYALEARIDIAASANRTESVRAFWAARECQAIALTAAERVYRGRGSPAAREAYWRIGLSRDAGQPAVSCEVGWSPVGATLSLGIATAREIALLLENSPFHSDANALVAALSDWQDDDSRTEESGAEDGWYRANGRVGPRNGPVTAEREWQLIRGWEEIDVAALGLSVGHDRVSLDHAPREVLRVLPGFSPEVVEYVIARRSSGAPIESMRALVDNVSSGAGERLQAAFAGLTMMVLAGTEAWHLHVTATGGATLWARVERRGAGLAITKEWVE